MAANAPRHHAATVARQTLKDASFANRAFSGVDADARRRFQREAIPLLEPLYRQALRMTHSHCDAEDLLQETMASAYAAFGSLRPASSIRAWLYRILANAYIDSYRKKQRQPMRYLTDDITDQQLAAAAQHSTTELPSTEEQALKALPDNDIMTAMLALPEEFRIVVYDADIEGLCSKEIAKITDSRMGQSDPDSIEDDDNCAPCWPILPQRAATSARSRSPRTTGRRQAAHNASEREPNGFW